MSALDDVPDSLLGCSPHFVLLLAVDASGIEDQRISAVARTLLDRGVASFSVWGPDCDRVHDLFDIERDPKETDERLVVTTWHDRETILEAACYFDLCALPPSDFERDCTDWVAIAVDHEDWGAEITDALLRGFVGAN